MSMDRQGTKCRRNVAENFNRLSRVHERYRRQTDDRQTDRKTTDRRREFTFANKNSSGDEIANVNFFYNIAHVEASTYAH